VEATGERAAEGEEEDAEDADEVRAAGEVCMRDDALSGISWRPGTADVALA
jgi:hypothetical protein